MEPPTVPIGNGILNVPTNSLSLWMNHLLKG